MKDNGLSPEKLVRKLSKDKPSIAADPDSYSGHFSKIYRSQRLGALLD